MFSRNILKTLRAYPRGLLNTNGIKGISSSLPCKTFTRFGEYKTLQHKVKSFSTLETRLAWDPTKPAAEDNDDEEIEGSFEPGVSKDFSRTADDISALLFTMEVTPGRHFVVGESAIVDIGIFVDGYQIAIEVENRAEELRKSAAAAVTSAASSSFSGASSSSSSAPAPSLRDLKRRFLQQSGWHVAYVDDDQWATLTTYEAKKKVLLDALSVALGGLTLKHGSCGGSCGNCGCDKSSGDAKADPSKKADSSKVDSAPSIAPAAEGRDENAVGCCGGKGEKSGSTKGHTSCCT